MSGLSTDRSQLAHGECSPVVLEVTIELLKPGILDVPNLVADGGDQVLVVRDDNDSAFVVIQSDDEGVHGVYIQVICGLIQH